MTVGQPPWLDARPPIPERRTSPLPARADVCIVGGGLTGASVLNELSKRATRGVLLERSRLASGSTGRGPGTVVESGPELYRSARNLHGDDAAREAWRLARENLEALSQRVGVPPSLSHRLSAASDDERRALRDSAADLARDGVESTSENGSVRVRAVLGIDSVALVEALAAEAEAAGAQVREGVAVLKLESASEGHVRVVTSAGTLQAEIVVVATNAWSPLLHDAFRETVAALPVALLATSPLDGAIPSGSCDYGRRFFGPGPGGRLVFGLLKWAPMSRDSLERLHSSHPLDEKTEEALKRAFRETLPEFERARVVRTWSGAVATTCDGLPLVGPLPGRPRLVAAVGFAGPGLAFGAVCGRAIAEAITGGSTLGLGAFSHWRLV